MPEKRHTHAALILSWASTMQASQPTLSMHTHTHTHMHPTQWLCSVPRACTFARTSISPIALCSSQVDVTKMKLFGIVPASLPTASGSSVSLEAYGGKSGWDFMSLCILEPSFQMWPQCSLSYYGIAHVSCVALHVQSLRYTCACRHGYM